MGQDFSTFNLGPDRNPRGRSGSKPLLTVLGIFAAIIIIGAIAVAFIYFYLLPQSQQSNADLAAQQNAAATATANMLTQEANISIWATGTARAKPSQTPTNTQTPLASKTPTVGTVDPRTATVAVIMTQAAAARLTATYQGTAGILPKTGFADEVGLPGLVALSLTLIVVIYLVRRLRTNTQT
jgi:cytoskeletal protein RodZ